MVVDVHSSLAGGPVGRDILSGLPQELAFPAEEYECRIEGVRRAMAEAKVDVFVVRHPPNVFYLSGFQSFSMFGGECVILPLNGDPDPDSPPSGAGHGPPPHLDGRGARLPGPQS